MPDVTRSPELPPHPTVTNLSEMAAVVADPSRANMLMAMMDGAARTARELADCAGVSPQTASTHLGRLLACGLVRMEKQGRHHYHRLASAEVAHMIETMHLAAAALPRRSPARTGPADESMRTARSCYDHLAGRMAVALTERLTECDYIRWSAAEGELTDAGSAFLSEWGIELAAVRDSRRQFCRPCLDWSERRPHVAGALGAAILDRLLELGWMRRRTGTRALSITPPGVRGFASRFGIDPTTAALRPEEAFR